MYTFMECVQNFNTVAELNNNLFIHDLKVIFNENKTHELLR